jgi:chemotaxis protein MotA
MRSNIVGLVLGIVIIGLSVTQTSQNHLEYFDILSLLIVVGGTFSVSIMTNGFIGTVKPCLLFFRVVTSNKYNNVEVTRELLEISTKYHFGNLEIETIPPNTYHPFIMDGLKLLHNKFEQEKIRAIMTNMMSQRSEYNEKMVERIELISKYPPAFGMAGTIIGLVAVLKRINSPDSMSSIGPSMAVALLTTLYGILLSSYFFQPVADNLRGRGLKDIKVHQIITDGMTLICEGHDPVYVREALLSFLTQEERKKISQDGGGLSFEQDSGVAA